ncbi:MAG: hypothetical protein H0W93_09720 [Gammaproteobacteria bacterium]|nr:hypothetical protein [Gammaproteobacteria bacterium]
MKNLNALRVLRVGLNQPELNIAIFAFLLNFVWEMWQLPFYEGIAAIPYWKNLSGCTLATLGDVVIALSAFWVVAIVVHSRWWILHPSLRQVLGLILIGVVVTILFEALATGLDRWRYAETMPTLLLVGTGLTPLLQWIVLPPIIVFFVRRQLACR